MEKQKNQNKENGPKWSNIPHDYKTKIDEIKDDDLKNIYSKFSFKYYKFNESQNYKSDNENFVSFVFNYLIKYKFIIFHLIDDKNKLRYNSNFELKLKFPSKTNCIICVENECLIIEQIEKSLLSELLLKLKEEQIPIINLSQNPNHALSPIENDAKEEVQKFCEYFQDEMKQNNLFVSYTIDSISGYLIRRHYFQSSYFNDPNFFNFDQNDLIEHEIKKKFNDYNLSTNKEKESSEEIKNYLDQIRKLENNFQKYEFKEDEFIKLRSLYTKTDSFIYLVIHIKTLHLFCMKKFVNPIVNGEDNREIKFSKYSHRCFVRCYGLIKKNDKTIGIIYKFMSNGNLDTYITNKNNKVENIFLLTTIIRIITGIEYLQKNQQIHRDLKPSNILIDHDYLPYISDFETIKSISTETTNTQDIGSSLYSSPEQDEGSDVSYQTDIYSFGLIIYFLIEKKDMFEMIDMFLDKKKKSNK